MRVEIISFSYKVGPPQNYFVWSEAKHGGGFVFDCRCLPNPGRLPEFKLATGKDIGVAQYIEQQPASEPFRKASSELVINAISNYLDRGFGFLAVAFGCTGGQHRSVYFAERLAKEISGHFGERVAVQLTHTNLGKS